MDETRLGLVRPLLSESEKSTSGEVMIGVGPDPFEYDPAPSSSRTSSTSTDSPVPNWMLGEVLLEAGSVTVMTAVRKEARQFLALVDLVHRLSSVETVFVKFYKFSTNLA